MLNRMMLPTMLVGAMVFASVLRAEEEKCSADAKKECSACPITAAMNKLPKITYVVGETKTGCAKTANKLATEQAMDVVYVVGKEEFTDAGEAKSALLSATEKFIEGFANPHVCKVSGATTIAGQTTTCSKTAAHLTGLMAAATKNIHLTFAVGEETCNCPDAAASLAKSSGKPKWYVVGKEKTECEVTARLNLARAKYRAIVVALAKAEKETGTDSEES